MTTPSFSRLKTAALALFAALLFTAAPGTPSAQAADYAIDIPGQHASIQFRANHLGFSVLTGRFDKFDGSFTFDENNPAAGKVLLEIDTTSINSNHAKRDDHLRADDFFDVAKYPTASFVSKSIKVTGDKTGIITGDLTIRGVTKSVDVDVTMNGMGKDPWGGFRAGFSGTATIIPADYGMTHVVAKAPVELVLEIEGIRK